MPAAMQPARMAAGFSPRTPVPSVRNACPYGGRYTFRSFVFPSLLCFSSSHVRM